MIQFDVPDMSCGACADRIGKALTQTGLPADLQVEIDVAARQVRVPLSSQAEVAQAVRQAIEHAGYTAEPAKTAPTTAPESRSGGCCCAARQAIAIEMNQCAPVKTPGCCN